MTTLLYKKPEALLALSTEAHGIIAASAGTGKTYTLQHLVVEILLEKSGVRLDEILLVTFTVAATSDLKAKIRETLGELIRSWELVRAAGLEVAYLKGGEPAAWEEEAVPDTYWAIDLEGIKRLRHGLRNFDRAAIYTIHGFCQRILVEHAFANRRLFEQEHVSTDDVIAEAFAEMLRRDVVPGSDAQRWLGAYLAAGNDMAGLRDGLADFVGCTGDYRPVETIDLQAFQRFVLDLRRALSGIDAGEWKKEMKPLVKDADGATASTSKAVGDRIAILQEEFLPRIDEEDPVANLFLLNQVFGKKFDYFNKEAAQIVLHLAGGVGDALRGIEEYQKNCGLLVVHHLGDLLARQVATLKEEEGYFTFDDMVRVVRDTLVEEGEDGHLLASLREQFSYGLIDEFQDTDGLQWEIFSRVFVDSPEEGRHFLYLIGDPKQAIYGFRGGDVYTYLDACEKLRSLGAKTTALTDNYRSTPAVIAAYNGLFDSGGEGAVELGDRIDYEPGGVSPGKSWLTLRIDGEDSPVGLTALELITDAEEVSTDEVRAGLVEHYAEEIRRLVDGEQVLEYQAEEGSQDWEVVGAEDIYVLCRRRADLEAMATALRARGVPFAFLKMPGLFQTPEVRDIYDLLLALDDPQDRSRVARAWMTPFFDLTLSDVETLADGAGQGPQGEMIRQWSRACQAGQFGDLFNRILSESGLIRRRLLLERGERRLTNYRHLFEILAAEASRQVQTVGDLAVRLKSFMDGREMPEGQDAEQQRLETEEAAVQLLTIHGSKGLQRGVVFVVPRFGGVNRRHPPFRFHEPTDGDGHRRVEWHGRFKAMPDAAAQRYTEEAMAEELRLAYVAITRAELMVYLPWAAQDSPIRQNRYISADPFMAIVERMERLDEGDTGAGAVSYRPVSIDVERATPTVDEVREGLATMDLGDRPVLDDEVDAEEARRWRQQLLQRRWEVTSFSKLKKQRGPVIMEEEKGDRDRGDALLPGGMATGNFIHLVLEELDYRWVKSFERDRWLSDEEVRQFFELRARRFGRFDEEAIGRAMEMVYDTLAAPVVLDGQILVEGLWSLEPDKISRELEFLFPVPEQDGAGQWHKTFRSGAKLSGGFVTGFVDLLFEYDGKVYFADWKSDLASPYDGQALARLVNARYEDQAGLYSLAVARMLGVDDREQYDRFFGGFFYFFARGMTSKRPGQGIFGGRLGWGELEAYERSLFDVVQAAKVEPSRRVR